MTMRDIRHLFPRALAFVVATACTTAVATAQQPDTPGTGRFPAMKDAASVAVSWLDWQLRGDARSAKRFVGDDCGLCKDTQWSLQRKQFPDTRGSK